MDIVMKDGQKLGWSRIKVQDEEKDEEGFSG